MSVAMLAAPVRLTDGYVSDPLMIGRFGPMVGIGCRYCRMEITVPAEGATDVCDLCTEHGPMFTVRCVTCTELVTLDQTDCNGVCCDCTGRPHPSGT